MKRLVFLALAIFISNLALAENVPSGLFTITVNKKQLVPIIWVGQGHIYALGTAKINDQVADCVPEDPDQEINEQDCKTGKATSAAMRQAYQRIAQFLGKNWLEGFQTEEDAVVINETVYVIGRMPFNAVSVEDLPSYLKSDDGKFTPIIMESSDHRYVYALGIAQIDPDDDPDENVLNAIEQAEDNCQTSLEIYLGQEVAEDMKVVKRTGTSEENIKTAFALGKVKK